MSFEELKEVFVDTLNCDADKVTMEASLTEDLQADSLDAVELNMAFEDKFGITIADEDLGTLKTVGDIFNYLVRLRPAGCSRNLLNVKNAAAAPPARFGPKACMYAPIAGYICPLEPITGSARFWTTEPLRN